MVALTPRTCIELEIPLSEEDQKKTYVEVSGRSAAVPPLDEDTKDRLRSLRRELQPR